MFEIEHIKIFKRESIYLNGDREYVYGEDYLLQIGDSFLPTSFNSEEYIHPDLSKYEILLSTSSLSVLISWLVKYYDYQNSSDSKKTLYEFIYHYFYALFCDFFKDLIDKMEFDIHELEKL